MTRCKNCAYEFDAKYCPTCGQKASTKRFSTRILFSHLLDKILPLDRGVIFTARRLLTHPGQMLREYLDGKRVGYTKPFQFLLIITAISLIVFTQDDFQRGMKSGMATTGGFQNTQITEFQQCVSDFMTDHMTLLMIGMIPFLALVGRWFYKKHDVNYAEHVVMNCYLLASCTMITIPFLFLMHTMGMSVYTPMVSGIFGLMYVAYFVWGHISFFKEKNKLWNGIKGMFTILVAYIFYILATMILVLIITLFYFLIFKKG